MAQEWISAIPNAPANAGAGVAAFGSMLPAYGTAVGGSHVINATMGMLPKGRIKKKRGVY